MKKKIYIVVLLLVTILQIFSLGLNHAEAAVTENVPESNFDSECPEDYYDSLLGLKGDELLENLATLTYTNHRYYNKYDELKGGNAYADANPENPNEIIDFYSQYSYDNNWGTGKWEREHVWCQSLSGGLYPSTGGSTRGAGADIHAIRQEIGSINGSRNNSRYGEVSNKNSYAKYYNFNNMSISSSGTLYGYLDGEVISNGLFEPKDEVKGDVARILMYLYMHYSSEVDANKSRLGLELEGDDRKTQSASGNLVITNIVYTPEGTNQSAWDLLLKWNEFDEVSLLEKNRNDYCASVTGTRNPFIDHSEFAEIIWDTEYDGFGALIEDDPNHVPTQINKLVNKYYNNGVYTKKTRIELSSLTQKEMLVYFGDNVQLEKTTYVNGENMLMGDIDGTFENINSGYKTSSDNKNVEHYIYDFENETMNVDSKVENKTLFELYPSMVSIFDVDCYSNWESYEYVVGSVTDACLRDFIEMVAPGLEKYVLESKYFTAKGMKLTVSEESGLRESYLSLKIYVSDLDSGKVKENLLLSEARIYKGNVAFDDTKAYEEEYSFRFSNKEEVNDVSLDNQLTNSGKVRTLTLNDRTFKFTPTWKNTDTQTNELTGYYNIDDLKGVQIGSSKLPATTVLFETELEALVNKVAINASVASDAEATLSIYIDDTEIVKDVALTTTQTVYSYSLKTPLKGTLKYVISQPETSAAIYVQAFSINSDIVYEEFDITTDSSVENGTISVSKNKAIKYDEVVVTITPNEGYTLEKLYINGQEVNATGNEYSIVVTSKTTISAKFMLIKNDNFTWTNKWSSLADGQYQVILSYVNEERYIAPTTFDNNKFRTVTYNSVNDYTNYTFTIIKSGNIVNIKVGAKYLAHSSSTNFKFQDTAYNWSITTHTSGSDYLLSSDSSRYIGGNVGANFIGPYAKSFDGSSGYPFVEFAVIE